MSREYTPREVAHQIALDRLKKAFDEPEALEVYCRAIGMKSPSQIKRAKNWIAHLHNKLMDQSGLDGTLLQEGDV